MDLLLAAKRAVYTLACGGDYQRYMRMRAFAVRYASRFGLYEREHIAFLKRYLRPGDTAVDVGANLGAYALAMAQAVGPNGRVFAFEPLTEAFDRLTENTRRLPNVSRFQIALSDQSGARAIHVPLLFGSVPEVSLATLAADGPGDARQIEAATLDDFRDDLRGLRFIKADIEGHEPAFLRGAERVIAEHRPLIQFECSDLPAHFDWFQSFGARFGQSLCALNAGALVPAQPTSPGNNFYLVPQAAIASHSAP